MAFDPSDPRTALAINQTETSAATDGYAEAQAFRFHEMAPCERGSVHQTWWIRGQNFALGYSECEGAASFPIRSHRRESVLLLPGHELEATLRVGSDSQSVPPYSIVVVPPGEMMLETSGRGQLVELVSFDEPVAESVANPESYVDPHPNVASLVPWPEPPDGFRIRTYSLDVPRQEGRFGRIWRCTTFMVNVLDPTVGPRDTTRMSPHSHADFEQCSLAIEGDYVHHLRWPWTTNLAQWLPDVHEHCPSPSAIIIPPPSIHTSQAMGEGVNQLIDIFSPPRVDFSERPGWVLNADEYPMPADLSR